MLLGQLIMLLWLKGLASSATRRLDTLGDASRGQIGRVNRDIAQVQKEIAAQSSPAQLKRWADERGWQLATPDRFDDVSKRTPLPDAGANSRSANSRSANSGSINAANDAGEAGRATKRSGEEATR